MQTAVKVVYLSGVCLVEHKHVGYSPRQSEFQDLYVDWYLSSPLLTSAVCFEVKLEYEIKPKWFSLLHFRIVKYIIAFVSYQSILSHVFGA